MLKAPDGGGAVAGDYTIVGQVSTEQINPNNTTTPIEQITFYDKAYGVTATFNVAQTTYQADGAKVLVTERATQLEQLCGHAHVVGARGGQDQDPRTGQLYNYLVLTVGTDDYARTSEVWVRMDHLGEPAAFAAVDHAWKLIQDLGPTGNLVV